jgi:hypothetical protein
MKGDKMKRIKLMLATFVGVFTVLVPVLALSTAPAMADPTTVPLCPGGDVTAVHGTHKNLTITGQDYVATAGLTVRGNLTIAPGACLDAFSLAPVHVRGSIFVYQGATLALGCSPGALGPPIQPPCNSETTSDTVGGNIVASQPLTMYLTANNIGGSVVSIGGGPGLGAPPTTPYVNFPTKENTIGGNLVIEGWQGAWMGAVRNNVGGNVIISNNTSAINPDSTEVATNTIGGNLICTGNSPAAQFGDSGGTTNAVGGKKKRQCAGL